MGLEPLNGNLKSFFFFLVNYHDLVYSDQMEDT